MLSVSGLDQYYGGSHTLRSIDLDVPAGSCTVPRFTGSSPIRQRRRVVLPTPFRPSSAVQVPAGTSKSMARSAWLPP